MGCVGRILPFLLKSPPAPSQSKLSRIRSHPMKAFGRRNFLSKFLETEGAFVRDRERRVAGWAPCINSRREV